MQQSSNVSLGKVAILALGPAVALGWARFAYGFLLPAMRESLNWSYGQAGAVNTGEAAGYLLGALITDALVRRWGLHQTFKRGILVVIVGLVGCAFTENLVLLIILRVLAGVGAAATFISGASLVANGAGDSGQASAALSLYMAGVGFGIVVSAISIPYVLSHWSASAWPWGWVLLAAFSVFSYGAVRQVLPAFPEGDEQNEAQDGGFTIRPLKKLLPITAGYTLFGMGYVGYMTFFIAYLGENGITNAQLPYIWVLLGSAVIAGSFLWGRILSRVTGGSGFALINFVVVIGVLVPLLSSTLAVFILSATLVGSSILAVPPSVFQHARNKLQQKHWTGAISALTICFGVGQAIGPVLIGAIADWQHSIAAGILSSVAILVVALLVGFSQNIWDKRYA